MNDTKSGGGSIIGLSLLFTLSSPVVDMIVVIGIPLLLVFMLVRWLHNHQVIDVYSYTEPRAIQSPAVPAPVIKTSQVNVDFYWIIPILAATVISVLGFVCLYLSCFENN